MSFRRFTKADIPQVLLCLMIRLYDYTLTVLSLQNNNLS